MLKNVLLMLFLLWKPFTCLSQHVIKAYFIQKLPSRKTSDLSDTARFKSAAGEVYLSIQGKKIDSLFIKADDFKVWNDSVSFSLNIPYTFFSVGSTISATSYFYLENRNKGNVSGYLQGKEQSVPQIKLKIKSDPVGAEVYLIPKLYWERNPQLAKYNLEALNPYLVGQGLTPVYSIVQEYVYIVVFSYKKKFKTLTFSPTHLSPIDSIFRKLN